MTDAQTWPSILGKLLARTDLSRGDAAWAMAEIMSGESDPAQIGGFMVALRAKGESVAELAGLVDTMLENAVILDTGNDALDIVGTGGDMVGTVNISSMAAIVAAATGIPVMKHGSRSASGKAGSSEMLEVLGIRLDLSPERVAEVFRETGLTFFFAPVFHPSMRHVAPIRKALGVPTTFNFLGPLANPAQPIATALGVSNHLVAPLMASELANRGRNALVFRGSDGLDELTTTGSSQIWAVSGGKVFDFALNPADLGLKLAESSQLLGGDAHFNANVTRSLLAGERAGNMAAIREIVALNAGAGLAAYRMAKGELSSLSQESLIAAIGAGIEESFAAIDSGSAANKLSAWMSATQL